MGLVMADVDDPAAVTPPAGECPLLLPQAPVDICLSGQTLGGEREPLEGVRGAASEVEACPVGERHHVDLRHPDTRRSQAERDGVVGEGLGVLLAVEPLLFHEGHRQAVLEQGGGRVVGEAVDPQDVHERLSSPEGPSWTTRSVRM